MDELVTIATFTFPHEMAILRAHLESEGIKCFTKDEMLAQVYNFNSQAIGGVKLQIKKSDLENALPILINAGYYKHETDKSEETRSKLEKLTGRIPFLKKLSLEMRMLLLILIIVGTITVGIFFLLKKHF